MQTEDLKESSKQTTAEETPQQEAQTNTADAANGVDETAGKKSEGAAEEKTPEQDEKDVKIEELQNRILRLQADFDNFRRRNTSEREQLATFVTADVVGKFLKVLDNFERAEDAARKSDDAAGIYSGIEMIRRQFEQTFKDLGVEEITEKIKQVLRQKSWLHRRLINAYPGLKDIKVKIKKVEQKIDERRKRKE